MRLGAIKHGVERDRYRVSAIVATLTAGLMIAQQVGAKATRDALFLSTFAATELPRVMVGAAVLSIVAALAMSRWIARRGPTRPVPLAFAVSAGLFVAEWWLTGVARGPTAVIVYLHTSVFGGLVVSGFWAVVNERFDPHTAKQVVGRIGAGAALGGVVGGVAAQQITALLNLRSVLLVLCAVNLLAALGAARIGRTGEASKGASSDQRWSGMFSLGRVGYLRHMASLVMLAAGTGALVEYTLKSEAASRMLGDASLMSFFATFYTATAVLTFVVQSTLSGRALQGLGLAGTIAVLPAAVVVAGVLAAALPALWTVVLLCGAESVLVNSMFRSGYEPLYTPLPTDKKRPAKIMIDVAFERMGSAGGAGLVMLLLIFTQSPNQILIGMAVALATAALWNSYRLHHGYVQALADSLRTGTIALDESEIVDATTRRTLSDTTHALNREQLLAEIQAYRMRQQPKTSREDEAEEPDAAQAADVPVQPLSVDPLLPLMNELYSQDVSRIRKVLATDSLDPRAASLVIPLLGHPELVRDALQALRKIAPQIVGQLADALLAPGQSPVVRRRIPWVLKVVDDPRACEGLFKGLSDARFDVRYTCARAMAEIRKRNNEPRASPADIFAAVSRELQQDEQEWQRRKSIELEPAESGGGSENQQPDPDVESQSLEHVFTLLGLVLDRETLKNSLRALKSHDTRLRGTSLEYLENVLPEQIRRELWPRLGAGRIGAASEQSRKPGVLQVPDSVIIERPKPPGDKA